MPDIDILCRTLPYYAAYGRVMLSYGWFTPDLVVLCPLSPYYAGYGSIPPYATSSYMSPRTTTPPIENTIT